MIQAFSRHSVNHELQSGSGAWHPGENFSSVSQFPEPGIRCPVIIGEVTAEKVGVVRAGCRTFTVRKWNAAGRGIPQRAWRGTGVNAKPSILPRLTNMRSVVVMGDERTYDYASSTACWLIRVDFMTAEAANIPFEVLQRVMSRIINEVKGVNRCFMILPVSRLGAISSRIARSPGIPNLDKGLLRDFFFCSCYLFCY